MVKAIASIITPITLITALMFYFGLIHSYWFFAEFGVDYTIFELSPEDYILRSADSVLFPLGIVALTVLVLAWVVQLVARKITPARALRLHLWTAIVFSAVGIGLTMIAVVAFVSPYWLLAYPAAGGLSLVFGVLLLTGATRSMRWIAEYHGHARRRSVSWAVAEWTAVITLVSVGLFWAVGDWSAGVGSQRARQVVAGLPGYPSIVLFSDESLDLTADGVTETACATADGGFVYRYDGLVLITQEGGQMMLLPRTWTADSGVAVVLPKTAPLRLEFSTQTDATPVC